MKCLVLVPLLVAALAAVVVQSSTISVRDKIPAHLKSGSCPNVNERTLWQEQVPNHPRYAGKWYEVARSDNVYQLVKTCTKNDLSYDGPGKGFSQITTGMDTNGEPILRSGKIFPFANEANAETPHLSIHFEQPSAAAPYVILDTDYDNFSCIYSCMDFTGNFKTDFLHVWSRTQEISNDHMGRCMSAYRNLGLDTNRIQMIPQSCDQ